jgi:hypothetical protein
VIIVSNYLSIATVTAALRWTLQSAINKNISGADVRTVRPDETGGKLPSPGVNIFLYQVTQNPALRNEDLPGRLSKGQLIKRPNVPLDLHYLLTFYGDDDSLMPQRLLGSVVSALHSRPVLTRQMIKNMLEDPTFNYLTTSNLADSIETVKFTQVNLSLEELSKIWSVFFQTHYSLSLAYMGTAVIVESEDIPQKALPVLERGIYTVLFDQPCIEKIVPVDEATKIIVAGSTIIIKGKSMAGEVTVIRIGEFEISPSPENLTRDSITVTLPAGLRAGILGLQVVHKILMGKPPVPHRGVESNVFPFILSPRITGVTVSSLINDGSDNMSGDITLDIDPEVGKKQRVIMLLNERDPPSGRVPWAYVFEAISRDEPADPGSTGTLSIPVKMVKKGHYLVRVQIDGAESELGVDSDDTSPTYNQYIVPEVEI